MSSARRFRPRSRPTKRATKSLAGLQQELGGRRVLRQVATDLHDGDPVAHLDRLVDVVGDEEDRRAQRAMEPQELVLQAIADDRIDGAERLVHEHDRRLGGHRAGHADALALAAGELRRIAVADPRRVEPDQRQQLLDAGTDAVFLPAEQLRDRGDVVGDGLVGEQAGLLDHVADAAAQLGDLDRHHVLAVDEHRAGGWLDRAD